MAICLFRIPISANAQEPIPIDGGYSPISSVLAPIRFCLVVVASSDSVADQVVWEDEGDEFSSVFSSYTFFIEKRRKL